MADFVAVIRKTIDGLPENSPETRARVYEKARATIAAKLAAIDPPPPAVVVQRQKDAIEEAIRVVEAQFAAPEPEPEDDFDDFFAEIDSHVAAEPEPQQPAASFSPPPLTASATGPDVDDDQAREDASSQESLPPEMVPVGPAETRGHDMDPVIDAAAPVSGAPMLEPVAANKRPEPRLATSGEHALAAGPAPRRPARRRSLVGPIAAVVALVAIAGASYGIWLNREEFASLLGLDEGSRTGQQTAAQQPAENRPAAPDNAAAQPNAAETASPSSTAGQNDVPEKFTQRLTPTGDEIDEGPAGTPAGVGEGTSVAAVTQPPAGNPPAAGQPAQTPATPQSPANGGQPAVPVGQRAIFYEERTSAAMGTAEQGSIVWSLIQESPGNNLPPEPAIRAELVIPSKDLEMRLTIRRNADASLPASHIVEMIFLTPEGFQGGSVSNVLRLAFKPSEEAPGNPLVGIPAKIADGYFLVALSDQQADIAVNMQLMQRQSWIDIPIIYSSGRRALVTMEKGVPGDRIFNEAIQSWQSAATGSAG